MRTGNVLVTATAGLVLLLAVGCGDDGAERPGPGSTTTTAPTTTAAPPTSDAPTTTTEPDSSDAPATSDAAPASPYMDGDRVASEMAWNLCSTTAEEIFAEAGTRDPSAAAGWYGRDYAEEVRPVVVDACRAGLRGDPLPSP